MYLTLYNIGAVMVFDRAHPFLYFAMHDLMSTYDLTLWDVAGPRVITRCVNAWHSLHSYMVRWVPVHKTGTTLQDPLQSPFLEISSLTFY